MSITYPKSILEVDIHFEMIQEDLGATGQQNINKDNAADRVCCQRNLRESTFRKRMNEVFIALFIVDVLLNRLPSGPSPCIMHKRRAPCVMRKRTLEANVMDGALITYFCVDIIYTKLGPKAIASIENMLWHCVRWLTPIVLLFLVSNGCSSVVSLFLPYVCTVHEVLSNCKNRNPDTILSQGVKRYDQGNELVEPIFRNTQQCRHFTFAEIQLATQDFDDAFVIGKGGFGKVYKGSIDGGGTTVAIKRLDRFSRQGQKEFQTEIHVLSKLRHSNLVSLIGYCKECDEMILVYEYMSKGSLADLIHPKSAGNVDKSTSLLCWVQRLKICIGTARGLDYLHTGTSLSQSVIHRDVKTSNILLDENLSAKVSDFGLSKIGPANQSCTNVTTCVKGTRGYIDPDYLLTQRLTRKSDVYGFGVVLFQVLSGRQAISERLPKDQRILSVWAQNCIREDHAHYLIDPCLKWEIFPDSMKEFVKIAERCLHNRPKKRPKMSEVVASLESALALQELKDSSLLDKDCDFDFDFDFGGTCTKQDTAEIPLIQFQVIDPGSGNLKMESVVSSSNNDDTLTDVYCMPKDV